MQNQKHKKVEIPIDELIEETLSYDSGKSVTQRVKAVKQPRGGYLKRTEFKEISIGEGEEVLNTEENVRATLIGISVDYLTRFMLTGDSKDAFKVSLLGAKMINEEIVAENLIKGITELDDQSIFNAIQLSGFDVLYRNGGSGYVPVKTIKPDIKTIENVRKMVNRTLKFFDLYGPVISDGFTFHGAYTKLISSGDGDYLTSDTLWDLKVLKNYFNKNHTLQLLIYWRMGLRSDYETFKNIKYLGIFNPRKNKVFKYDLNNLNRDTITIIDKGIIGYKKSL